MSEAKTPEAGVAEYRLADRCPREDLVSTLVMAGVWLGFLAFPFSRILTDPAPWSLRALGIAGLLGFCCVYLYAYVRPRLLPARPLWVSTSVYTAGMAACAALAAPTGGPGVLIASTYVCALWLFTHPWRRGLPVAAAVLLATVALTVLVTQDPAERFWIIVPLSLSALTIALVRYAVGRDERTRTLREELTLARQREAFAREVHDVLGHSLTVISMKTQLAARLVRSDPDRAQEELAAILALTRESIEESRSVVSRTAPLTLDDQLAAAARALRAAGITADLPPASATDALSARADALFAACLREATTNVLRHSGARTVRVCVEPDRLRVVDDGVGGAAGDPRGHGLAGMRARAQAASATLTVCDDRADALRPGTRVEVRL
ncbi:sensor histidine kinase [Brevibacterium salitolerans]|uniref:Signal transduction histidine kinase subgroup 3 dimerisation and phosphoacceptor domain-containing protein n=1 Tax=Brevibacterium salitolerans TaxID=1403566 RepID=A0ABN2WE65_9MICO